LRMLRVGAVVKLLRLLMIINVLTDDRAETLQKSTADGDLRRLRDKWSPPPGVLGVAAVRPGAPGRPRSARPARRAGGCGAARGRRSVAARADVRDRDRRDWPAGAPLEGTFARSVAIDPESGRGRGEFAATATEVRARAGGRPTRCVYLT
jgi:hypothetical protein